MERKDRVHGDRVAFLSASSLSLTFLCVYEGLGLWADWWSSPGYFYEDVRPLILLEN